MTAIEFFDKHFWAIWWLGGGVIFYKLVLTVLMGAYRKDVLDRIKQERT